MNKILTTGTGLSVLITCDYCPHHSWMALASWYSFYKMLPDAKVVLLCNRTNIDGQMFDWVKTLRIPMRLHKPITKEQQIKIALNSLVKTPLLVVDPDVLIIREFIEDWQNVQYGISDKLQMINDFHATPTPLDWCVKAKEEKMATFVSYFEEWGNFVGSKWINKVNSPFHYRFGKFDMNPNERRVEQIWQQLAGLSSIVNRIQTTGTNKR